MAPSVTRRNPEMHSMSVVLPAPFGPMSPTISPSRTWRSTPSSAASPPKRTVTPRQSIRTSAELLSSEPIDEAGRDHLVVVVRLRLEHDHALGAVHRALATGERDGAGDEIAVAVVGRQRAAEPLARQVTTGRLQPALDERHDLVAARATRAVLVPVALPAGLD